MVYVADIAGKYFEWHLVDIDCFHALVQVLVPDMDLSSNSCESDSFKALAHRGYLDFVVIEDNDEFLKCPD